MAQEIKITTAMTMAQIQSYLNIEEPTIITFAAGTYKITQTLFLHKNTVLDLNGADLQQGAAINHILATYSAAGTTGYNGESNIVIKNGTLEGMGKFNTKLNLLTLCHAKNITIENMRFMDVVEFHSLEINSSSNVKVLNCKFHGHNSSLDTSDFREFIQIDSAVESALVIVPLGSKWYDATACENITIDGCEFKASSSRPAASQCIGNHCQVRNSVHRNIVIQNNTFVGGTQVSKNVPCIRLVNMENVIVRNNVCEAYGRFLQILTYDSYTYGINKKITEVLDTDGLCKNVIIEGNTVKNPSGTVLSAGVFITSATGYHELIQIKDNVFEAGSNTKWKYAIDVKKVYGVKMTGNKFGSLSTTTKDITSI